MKIVCTNTNGDSMTIQYAFPFYYVSCDGLMSYTCDIATAEPYIPGEVYQGSHNPKRTLLLTFAVKHREYWNLRDTVYQVFGKPGTFLWFPDTGDQRSINYYVESIEFSDPNSQGFRQCSVSLICPFPFFSGKETVVSMAYWKKNITLPFVMHSPFIIGERIAEQIKNIYNPQPINVGMIITFSSSDGEVTNPSLQNMTTGESFELSGSISPGTGIIVDTITGQKSAGYLNDPQGFDLWDYSKNDWIQLHPGDNVLRYDADSGLEYLDVTIQYSQLFIGG